MIRGAPGEIATHRRSFLLATPALLVPPPRAQSAWTMRPPPRIVIPWPPGQETDLAGRISAHFPVEDLG